MPVDPYLTDLIYPELLDVDIIVSSIRSPQDLRKNFLFCIDLNLGGLLTLSVKKAWPFKSLLIPVNQKKGAKGILIIEERGDKKELLLKVENIIRKLTYKKFLFAEKDTSCKNVKEDNSIKDLINEISYRTGKKLFILAGGTDERS